MRRVPKHLCPCVLLGNSNKAAHLKDLCSRPELVALVPVVEEVNGLAHMVPGILDLKTVSTEWSVGWAPAGRDTRF